MHDIGPMIRDLQDFAKKPKLLKAIKSINSSKYSHCSLAALSGLNSSFLNRIRDFHDIIVPQRTVDFPRSVLKLLAREKTKDRAQLRKSYIPVTHVLEQTKDWQFADETHNSHVLSGYDEDYDISSLSGPKGQRDYIRAIR